MIKLKESAKKEIKNSVGTLLKYTWIICGLTSTILYCFFGFLSMIDILMWHEYTRLNDVRTLLQVCFIIMLISAIPFIYLWASNIVDSFEIVPKKTKKEKILESDK